MIALLALLACSTTEATLTGLQSTNPAAREDALVDAADETDDRVRVACEKLLDDEDAQIRYDAIVALEGIKSPASVPALTAHVHDPDPKVAREAIDALGRIGDPSATGVLLVVVQEGGDSPPLNAIWALGAIKAKAAEPILTQLRRSHDKWVAHDADVALRAIAEDD